MRPAHSTSMGLTHRYREQARSHNGSRQAQGIRFSEQDPPVSSANRINQVAQNLKQNINFF
ncbi:hypothetical protein C1C98_24515 [Pseudomonas ogarae]|uniref:Uncharacterized protein n=1 Tax=Pseudomonas ogarae (strain DSM 112162 / CECT 30235 / F113) TaxID=1114970 RepID=A0ABM6R4G8_PSEO1|nr:hypothetical protein C1C98_24515 [Pseudomonas ogarae]